MQWADVLNDPSLQDLPYKIELNTRGNIEMSPASNQHGIIQGNLYARLLQQTTKGRPYLECSIATGKGVKVADVAWASSKFFNKYGAQTPLPLAPELCVEIVSPSNSQAEMQEKIDLYLAKGAQEVWLIDQQEQITVFSHEGKLEKSNLFEGI